jgi:hypothetical protein
MLYFIVFYCLNYYYLDVKTKKVNTRVHFLGFYIFSSILFVED